MAFNDFNLNPTLPPTRGGEFPGFRKNGPAAEDHLELIGISPKNQNAAADIRQYSKSPINDTVPDKPGKKGGNGKSD